MLDVTCELYPTGYRKKKGESGSKVRESAEGDTQEGSDWSFRVGGVFYERFGVTFQKGQ